MGSKVVVIVAEGCIALAAVDLQLAAGLVQLAAGLVQLAAAPAAVQAVGSAPAVIAVFAADETLLLASDRVRSYVESHSLLLQSAYMAHLD